MPDLGPGPTLTTARLLLRPWRESDLAPFAALNADPEVMEHFPAAMTREASDAFVHDRIVPGLATDGFGLWATERRDTGQFIDFVGLARQTWPAPFNPSVEVGWRLARPHWGLGLATEAARASLRHGFTVAGLSEIVSLTTVRNVRSRAVMERLGMRRDPADDFEHPSVPAGHPVRPHVLYRLRAGEWAAAGDVAPDTARGNRP